MIVLNRVKEKVERCLINHQMHEILDAKHVPIYKLIKFIKEKVVVIEADINMFLEGRPNKKRSKKYETSEKAIKDILSRKATFETRTSLLSSLARNITL